MEFDAIKNPPLSYFVLNNEIEFDTSCFWSKSGFADGDLISDLYYEYAEKIRHIDFRKPENRALMGSRLRPNPLHVVIEKLVLTQTKPTIEIKHYVTCHNGTRCDTEEIDLTPRYVYVSISDVLNVFDEIIEQTLCQS